MKTIQLPDGQYIDLGQVSNIVQTMSGGAPTGVLTFNMASSSAPTFTAVDGSISRWILAQIDAFRASPIPFIVISKGAPTFFVSYANPDTAAHGGTPSVNVKGFGFQNTDVLTLNGVVQSTNYVVTNSNNISFDAPALGSFPNPSALVVVKLSGLTTNTLWFNWAYS